MGGPRSGRHKLTVRHGVTKRGVGVPPDAAGHFNIGLQGRIGRAGEPLHETGGNEKLRSVADSGNGLARRRELLHDFDHARVEAQVLRSAAAGNVQPLRSR